MAMDKGRVIAPQMKKEKMSSKPKSKEELKKKQKESIKKGIFARR